MTAPDFYSCAWVTIAATDWITVVEFYQKFLDCLPDRLIPGIYAEFVLVGGLRLGIFYPNTKNASEFARAAGSGLSLCLEVSDLEEAIARLQKLGHAPPGEIVTASHGREIYAYDPAGNRLILHQS